MASTLTPEDRLRARASQIRTATSGMRWAYAWSAGGAVLMAFSIPLHRPATAGTLAAWCVVLILLHLPGAWSAMQLVARPATDADVSARSRPLAWHAAVAGSAWGAAPWVVLPTTQPEVMGILMISLCLVVIAGSGILSVHRPYLLGFVAPLAIIAGAGLGWHDTASPAVALALTAAASISMGLTQEKAVRQAIEVSLEKERLLAERARQQRLTDEARQAAEAASLAAQRANESKSAFLAAVGHDLRQPMHALVQYHGQLKRSNADRALSDTIDRMGRALDAIEDLLDASLEVSKLLLGAVVPEVSRFALGTLIDRLDAQMRPIAEDKGLALVISGPREAQLQTDSVLLERILRNLLLNALRYTERGSVALRAVRRGRGLRISVVDSGPGIAPRDRERIFEAFYQVGNAARDRRKGLGLGLAIVRQLCDLLGATVRVRTRIGRGSSFSVDLPCLLGDDAQALPPTPQAAARADYTRGAFVVVVDDDVDSLAATADSLRQFGCDVLCAASSAEAVQGLQQRDAPPHLVLSDYRLAGETGTDAIAAIIESERLRWGDEFAIGALLMTGDTTPAEGAQALGAGIVLLHKPVAIDVLYQQLNLVLTRVANPEAQTG